MSQTQINEIRDMVEGLVAGRLLEVTRLRKMRREPNQIPREVIQRISHNAGAYVVGQVREMVR